MATCRHVWQMATAAMTEEAQGRPSEIEIEYPRSRLSGSVERSMARLADTYTETEYSSPDLVLLRPDSVPSGVAGLRLARAERNEVGPGWALAGLVGRDPKKRGVPQDVPIYGTIDDRYKDTEGRRKFIGSDASDYWFELGCSGSPVFVGTGEQLAGIVSLSELGANQGKSPLRVAFVIPASTILPYLERLSANPLPRQRSADAVRGSQVPRTPSITAYGTDSEDPDMLIGSSVWKCYETLFPLAEERDDPTNLIEWLRLGYDNKNEWAEVFFTLTVDNTCIGMAYVSLLRPGKASNSRPKGWWFGNYFGILRGWRESGNAVRFLQEITKKCQDIMPSSKGIVFEVERYDNEKIKSALAKFEAKSPNNKSNDPVILTDEEKHSIRRALRIALYTAKGFRSRDRNNDDTRADLTNRVSVTRALSLVTQGESKDERCQFVDYVQPAMSDGLDPRDEVDLWLMVYPMQGLHIGAREGMRRELTKGEVTELIEFIYGELFPSAYSRGYDGGTSEDSAIAGFGSYVEEVRRRVQDSMAGKHVFLVMQNMLSDEAQRLLLFYGRPLDDLELYI